MEIKEVYNNISNEFDHSRFSVWKGVREFLDIIKPNTYNGDIGCGNGKNMLYRNDIKFEGSDICPEFVKICRNKGLNVKESNILNLDFSDNYFDNTICIAVIHHLKTTDERLKAIGELLRVTKSNGKILIYVWAMEQPENSKRKFTKSDELVPFRTLDGKIYERFYHIYKENELFEEVKNAKNYNLDFIVEKVFWEMGNWCIVLKKM